jgi:hypothetical protein
MIIDRDIVRPNFLPDGVEGGGSDTSSPSETTEAAKETTESSSSEVKTDVTSDKIPSLDDKGVPYYNRYRELEEKFKGVDLDKWKELSGIDLTTYKSQKEWVDLLLSDKDLYDQVLNMVKGYKKQVPQQKLDSQETVEIRKKLEELETWKNNSEKEKEELIGEQVRTEYESRFNKELESGIKSKNLRSLTEIEKSWLRTSVDNEYRQDWENSLATKSKPKLGWNELPKIVQKYLTTVDSARREALKGSIRKDGSPDAINGGGPTQFMQKPPNNETKAQRVQRIADELKQSVS